MWAKNGAPFLPGVLKRIDEIIPSGSVHQKIFVDDSSIDESVRIAKDFNWDIYTNREGWISGGKKEALSHVETDFFISVEQDVVLGRNWWDQIWKWMEDEKVAVAHGVRLSTTPVYRAYEIEYLKQVSMLPLEQRASRYFTVDNNLYRTKIVRQLGFSKDPVACAPFYRKVIENGFKWIVDVNLVSTHLRTSLLDNINHITRFWRFTKEHCYLDDISIARMLVNPLFALKHIRNGNAYFFTMQVLLRLFELQTYFCRQALAR